MDFQQIFEKYNQQYFIPKGASVTYNGIVDDSGLFQITDRNGVIYSHEFDPTLWEEEIESMLEMLSQEL